MVQVGLSQWTDGPCPCRITAHGAVFVPCHETCRLCFAMEWLSYAGLAHHACKARRRHRLHQLILARKKIKKKIERENKKLKFISRIKVTEVKTVYFLDSMDKLELQSLRFKVSAILSLNSGQSS